MEKSQDPKKKLIEELKLLRDRLLKAPNLATKHQILDSIQSVNLFLDRFLVLKESITKLDPIDQYIVKALIAIQQGPLLFQDFTGSDKDQEDLFKFITTMKELETFYNVIGGVVGYHLTVLQLLESRNEESSKIKGGPTNYLEPEGVDLSSNLSFSSQAVRWGIERMGELAEIYPVGGAGDRLHLQDEVTGQMLPAAELSFCGRSLLEGMVRDLQGREFLYYKLTNKQSITPLAMMTSLEKDNHKHILEICEKHNWFGRGRNHFFFMIQMLVPMITQEGHWALESPLHPILKPGGHGVIWKIALDQGLFEWLEGLGCSKVLVRQINNPVAGIDNGLLALAGIGCRQKKKFGFASCPRLLNTAEGMDVLCEKHVLDGYEYCLTNIEYTDFKHLGINDTPKSPGSPFSQFPANTNLLFVDLKAIKPLIKDCPIPGALINMKSKIMCLSVDGKKSEQFAGRLESTMQNIADGIVDKFPKRLEKGEYDNLSTFITFNKRQKTISVAKEAFDDHKSFIGTPEGAHFELMQNYYELLVKECRFTVPPSRDEKAYLASGPVVLTDIHPSIGPLYSVIAQKLRGGNIAAGSELILEVAEIDVENLNLAGSLQIKAASVMGKTTPEGSLIYDSHHCGKCILCNVTVHNLGVSNSLDNVFWKHKVTRHESLCIILYGNGEFFAEDVNFVGNFYFEVPDGHRMTVTQKNHKIACCLEEIKDCSWMWQYTFGKDDRIVLNKKITNRN